MGTTKIGPVNLRAGLRHEETENYQRHRINVDVGGSHRLTSKVMVLFAVRNKPFIRVQKVGDNPALGLLCQKFGVTPRVGVRATF